RAQIEDLDPELFDRPGKLAGGVASAFNDLRWSTKQIFHPTAAQIFFEDLVRVIKVTDNQVEAGEVIGEFRRQFRLGREKCRKRSVFDRSHCLRVKPILRKHRNVLVTEYLDVRTRSGVPQRLERRQSQNEITDRATADHQNALHKFL